MGTMRTVFYILMIIVSGGVFVYTVLAGGLTWIKASNAGILQFHKIFSGIYYWFYYIIVIGSLVISIMSFAEAYTCRKVTADSYAVGSQAFLAYEETPESTVIVDEEKYLLAKRTEYQKKAVRNQQNGFFYLFMSMLWCSMMILNTGFITEKGYYPMCSQKPRKLVTEIKDGELRFYTEKSADKPLLTVEDNQENRKYFAPLLADGKGT